MDAATYLGPYLPDEVAAAIATGDLDPVRRTVLGTVSDEVLALLAHLPVNAPARKQTVDAKPAAPVLVLGSDDDQVDGAAGKPDSQAEAAVSKAFENRVLKQITAQKVVDTRTRSPFFAKPATVAEPSESNLALEPVKAAQVANVAANPVDKPRRVITLKRINDENSPDPAPIIHAKVEKEPTTLSVVREEPEALPEASPPIALLDVEESTKQVAESGRESASQKVFHGMLNKYRLAQPSVPIPAPAPRAVPKPKLGDHLEAFSRSFPAYDFVHKPLEAVSGRQTVVDLDDDPDSPEEGGRSASSQPILPTQSAVTKRKRMSNPLPRPASQPQRTKKKIFLTNQPQLTSGWFSGWSPADRDEDEP